MTKRFCPECGASLAGDNPKFCSRCGHGLHEETVDQIIYAEHGNAVNVGHSNKGNISLTNNVTASHHSRPPVDLTPSQPGRMKINIYKAMITTALVNFISFVSGVFTIFDLNINKISEFLNTHKLPAKWWTNALLPSFFIIFVMSIAFFLWLLWMACVGSFRLGSTDWISKNGFIRAVLYRRKCPICGGVMEWGLVPSKENDKKTEVKWVCQRNAKLHQIDFDYTEIENAIKAGKLNFIFERLTF